MKEWISVDESLPKEHRTVLVYRENSIGLDCETFSTDVYWGGDWDYHSDITHWMPLPDPPDEVN